MRAIEAGALTVNLGIKRSTKDFSGRILDE